MGDRHTVLVVDDDLELLKLLTLRLERAGYEVVTARDGVEALDEVDRRRVDAAVVDVMMPRMDGHELVRRLRAMAGASRMPIVVLTAVAGDQAAATSMEAGADAHIPKPFSARDLVMRLDGLLHR